MDTTKTGHWVDQESFTLSEAIQHLKDMHGKEYFGMSSVLFDSVFENHLEGTATLKAELGLESAESMINMIQKERDADYKVGRLFTFPPENFVPVSTIVRSYSERWSAEKARGMNVVSMTFFMWTNPHNKHSVMKNIPDRVLFMSDLVFIQTGSDEFKLGRISHQFAKGGDLEKFL